MIDIVTFIDPEFITSGLNSIFNFPLMVFPHIFLLGPILVLMSIPLSHSSKYKKWIRTFGFIIFILATSYLPIINYLGPTAEYVIGRNYVSKHHAGLITLFTRDFDSIATCYASAAANCSLMANYSVLNAIDRDNSLYDFSSTYFLRLSSDGNLQRLHINGGFDEFQPDTREKKVLVNFISSNSPVLITAYIDNDYYPPSYLPGFSGETDIFIPVQVNGQTIGVLVRLYSS